MALDCLIISTEVEDLISGYNEGQQGRLLSAMMDYAFDDVEPMIEGPERNAWPELRRMIDEQR